MRKERSVVFLMANLGVEVDLFYTADSDSRREESYSRIIRIVDALKSKEEFQGRTQEIDMICTILADKKLDTPKLNVTSDDLRAYFMPFALKALSAHASI